MKLTTQYFLLSILILALFSSCKQEVTPEPDPTPDPTPNVNVTELATPSAGNPTIVTGNISSGEILDDLDWAALSNVACFPATRFIEFEGNQVYYSVEIPQGSEMKLTVTPTGEKKRINIYGYINFDGSNTPPVQSVTSCEAGYEIYVGDPDLTAEGQPQDISFAQAVNRSFTVFIAVSGARDVTDGDFELKAELL
ncbi:MAG: hypothetical protein AAF135_22910 [Bacteroidota bacterium]